MAYGSEVPQIQDKALNDAILSNDNRLDFLPFIELCHRHYADEVDLTFGVGPRRTVARDTLQGMLMDFLLPIHLISEMGGVEVTVEAQHITNVRLISNALLGRLNSFPGMALATLCPGRRCASGLRTRW